MAAGAPVRSAQAGVFGNVPEATEEGYEVLYELNLPEDAGFNGGTPVAYTTDNSGHAPEFDRVAYYLELKNGDRTNWVYVSMDAFTGDPVKLGLPHDTDNPVVHQQNVRNMNVVSNVDEIVTGTFIDTGNIEMWPSDYSTEDDYGVFAASGAEFDWGNGNAGTNAGHGSFQIHNSMERQTILAYNGWGTLNGSADDVGIGSQPSGNPDWSFAANAQEFVYRKLVVLVRPRTCDVAFTALPRDRQLYSRDLATGKAVVPVAGNETFGGHDEAVLRVYRDGEILFVKQEELTYENGSASFSFEAEIIAELAHYDFEVFLKKGSDLVLVERVRDVVAGDAFLFYGQSNAEAHIHNPDQSANHYASEWLLTFGQNGDDANRAQNILYWVEAEGDGDRNAPGAIGQWAMVLGRELIDAYEIPIAILNGARGGATIGEMRKDRTNPDKLEDSDGVVRAYNRLRYRAMEAGVADTVRAMFYYQGESDRHRATTHSIGYHHLRLDWEGDYPGLEKTYVSQVRPGCGMIHVDDLGVREVQRVLGDRYPATTVMATNALDGHDGCHYEFEHGYEEHGWNHFRNVARDLYDGPDSPDIDALNPTLVSFTDDTRTELHLSLRNEGATVDFPEGALSDFVIPGSSAEVIGRVVEGTDIYFQLSEPAPEDSVFEYQSHLNDGEWVTNGNGVGLLSFSIPVTSIGVEENGTELSGTNLNPLPDGSDAATLTVQLRDESGNPVARDGIRIVFKTTHGKFTDDEPEKFSLSTDSDGRVQVTLTSDTPGLAEVTAAVFGAPIANGSPLAVHFVPESEPIFNLTSGQPHTTIQEAIDFAEDGDVLFVDGLYAESLVIDKAVTFTGNLTLFNSLEPVLFERDTVFSGETVIVASDLVVAADTTLAVAGGGSLVLDGATALSDGRFNLHVEAGASLTLARSSFDGIDAVTHSGDTQIYNNLFLSSTVTVAAEAGGAGVYHNLIEDPDWLTVHESASITTDVDGWSNVTNGDDVRNRLALNLASPDAGFEQDGHLYVQPGDAVDAGIDLAKLDDSIDRVELLMGYHAGLLTFEELDSLDPWVAGDTGLFHTKDSDLGEIAIALDSEDPGSEEQGIASIRFTAGPAEGDTIIFFRVANAKDPFSHDARYAVAGSDTAEHLTPFTVNSGIVTIDGTPPGIEHDPVTAVTQDGKDMTAEGAVATHGFLDVEFDAFDALAGIDDGAIVVTIEHAENEDAIFYAVLDGAVELPEGTGTRYTFLVPIDEDVPDGEYSVEINVVDRAGNAASREIGPVTVETHQILVELELQGLVATPADPVREVSFVITDGNGEQHEITEQVDFSGGTGSAALAPVPGDATHVSAKAPLFLRRRLPVEENGDVATVSWTGERRLRGGDLNGNNVVATADLGIFQTHWGKAVADDPAAAAADINGNGVVATADLGIFQSNWGRQGDPP